MGKRQHQKDKLYLTVSEYSYLYGGRPTEANLQRDQLARFRKLPFDHCCLSLQPIRVPCCNEKGYVFDLENVIKFLKKFKKDPIDGTSADSKSFTKLNIAKSKEGNFCCPVLMKNFNEHSHIVAIKSTGNVFSHEAIDQLCLKCKNYRDPLNDQVFAKKDLITIQDPMNIEKQNATLFYHFKNQLKWADEEDGDDPSRNINKLDYVTKATLEELKKSQEKSSSISSDSVKLKKAATDKFNCASYSTGRAAAALTSTIMEPVSRVEAAIIEDDEIIYSRVKQRGYVQILTNLGHLNLELYCKETPRTCHNFIELCKKGYYDKTSFHRLIKNFIIQGGDPSATGKGGESIWKKAFKDEFNSYLCHQGRGMLSMANSGPNTNKSQFFITLKSCRHLDKKHTVFGKVVGGLDTLDKMEIIETDKNDKPKQKIEFVSAKVFVDPFEEAKKSLEEDRKKEKDAEERKKLKDKNPKKLEPSTSIVGSLIDLKSLNYNNNDDDDDEINSFAAGPSTKKSKLTSNFSNFSNW